MPINFLLSMITLVIFILPTYSALPFVKRNHLSSFKTNGNRKVNKVGESGPLRPQGRRLERNSFLQVLADDGKTSQTLLSNQSNTPTTPSIVEKQLNPLELCLCGAFATAFGDFVMHPIDTIKITQQTATVAVNIFQTAKNILFTRGIIGFYPGVLPYLIGDGISGAIKFSTFEIVRRFADSKFPIQFHGMLQFLCAAIGMLASSITLVPAEVMKTRLQAGTASSFLQTLFNTFQVEGIQGLYVGYYATLIRDVPYTMLELGIYENLKTFIKNWKKRELTFNEELIAAAITGGITSFITTPLDLVKTKLMMQSSSGGKYAGVVDGLLSIYQDGGVQALFVGSAARVAWLLPFTTIYLGVYEATKKALLQLKK